MTSLPTELSTKLDWMRQALSETKAAALRLRGTDWFAWATAGASPTVLLTVETGVAEVLVTAQNAWILTDDIEAERLQVEELAERSYQLQINPWADNTAREQFVHQVTEGGPVLSDRPIAAEALLPRSLMQRKRVLLPSEVERYRQVGRLASEAMTEVLTQAQPTWTEYQLAGAGAQALWARGLHPTLTLVAGQERLPLYRHPTPTAAPLGKQAMMVFCARSYGLYANLTRFVSFGTLSPEDAQRHQVVREVEAVALNHSQAEQSLNQIYGAIAHAYEQHGNPQAIRQHHQGGTTGYLAREVVANPTTADGVQVGTALAWNPSVVGAKVEDTFILLPEGELGNLTLDPNWPTVEVSGRRRPIPLER